jgi:hypothetical protein
MIAFLFDRIPKIEMAYINNEGTIIHIIPKKIEWVMGLRLFGDSPSNPYENLGKEEKTESSKKQEGNTKAVCVSNNHIDDTRAVANTTKDFLQPSLKVEVTKEKQINSQKTGVKIPLNDHKTDLTVQGQTSPEIDQKTTIELFFKTLGGHEHKYGCASKDSLANELGPLGIDAKRTEGLIDKFLEEGLIFETKKDCYKLTVAGVYKPEEEDKCNH